MGRSLTSSLIDQGVAQEDPLSPTLYAIFEDALLQDCCTQGIAWKDPLLGGSLHYCRLMILLALHSQQMACRGTSLIPALSMHASIGT